MFGKFFLLPILFYELCGIACALPSVVSDNDLVMARQEYGEARRNASVNDTPLRIAGDEYGEGIGSHATSMIPVSVPDSGNKLVLTGACGVDDSAKGQGSVRFSILSGSETIWQSAVMQKGKAASSFRINVPVGSRKLYLLADHVDNNANDCADWVNLAWEESNTPKGLAKPALIKAEKFGLKPNIKKDQTEVFASIITIARSRPGSTIVIPKGEYHFHPEKALRMSFHVSNHDQPVFHPISIPLVDLDGIKIEGNGSVFIFHGMTIPVLLMDSRRITIRNLMIDYDRPFYSEGRIVSFGDGTTDVNIDSATYPYEISGNKITFIGHGWKNGGTSVMAFKKGTNHIAEGTADMSWRGEVEKLGPGKVRLRWDLNRRGLEPGDSLVFRTFTRPHPACVIYRSEGIMLHNYSIHESMGMALLAQRSKDICMNGGGTFLRKDSGRVHTVSADATHFSNVGGMVKVENALFEGMMDDAINIHSTCLSIKEIRDGKTMLCEYKHRQAVGFEVFLPGETVQFIAGPTLENTSKGVVKSVRKLNTRELLITLESDIPAEVKLGDAIENGDYYPEVIFRGNTVRNNRARGALFTTPKRVLVEQNHFDHSSGSAILLAGDAQGWYESGACDEVIIRNNKFTNNLTSRYQFTNAIISIFPEIKKLEEQKAFYHRNILIENNDFETFDVPLLFAISTSNIVFRNNTIKYNNDYKGWGQRAFQFKRCADISIYGNKINPPKTWSLKDCKLELMEDKEVSFEPKKQD